jgi:hypothetical protein
MCDLSNAAAVLEQQNAGVRLNTDLLFTLPGATSAKIVHHQGCGDCPGGYTHCWKLSQRSHFRKVCPRLKLRWCSAPEICRGGVATAVTPAAAAAVAAGHQCLLRVPARRCPHSLRRRWTAAGLSAATRARDDFIMRSTMS